MEQRFFFGLLMLGEDNLALYYLLFCIIGSFGALQFVAGKYARRDLTPLPPRVARFAGAALVVAAFVWFFSARADLFIPGLAGGEFVAYAFAGFVCAYLITRTVVWAARVTRVGYPARAKRSQNES